MVLLNDTNKQYCHKKYIWLIEEIVVVWTFESFLDHFRIHPNVTHIKSVVSQ